MLRAVACPNCRVELDVPEELLGQPVRCSSCATTFTPAGGGGPRRDDRRDDSRNAALDDEDRPRRPPPRKSGRGLLGVVALLLAGTFGVCCLGCVGMLAVGVKLDNPTLQEYRSPDGMFVASFPGPPTATENALSGDIKLTGVAHSRRLMGSDFDTCSVQFYDLPKAPTTDAARDKVLQETADAYVAGQADMAKSSQKKLNAQGFPALEIVLTGEDPQLSHYARVIVAGKRVYVVSYDGHGLAPESQRLAAFWNAFRVLNTPRVLNAPADGDGDADPDAPVERPRPKGKVKPKDQ